MSGPERKKALAQMRMRGKAFYANLKLTSAACSQDVMGLFLQVFRRLDSPSAPSFQLCVSILDCVSQVPISCCGT